MYIVNLHTLRDNQKLIHYNAADDHIPDGPFITILVSFR